MGRVLSGTIAWNGGRPHEAVAQEVAVRVIMDAIQGDLFQDMGKLALVVRSHARISSLHACDKLEPAGLPDQRSCRWHHRLLPLPGLQQGHGELRQDLPDAQAGAAVA